MSRAQNRETERLEGLVAGLRAEVAALKGEQRGEVRGRHLVVEQLARDLQLGAVREEQHRVNAARAYGDMQSVLRIVAAHVLDIRGGARDTTAVDLLVDELQAAGISLRNAFIAIQTERAEATVRVTAAEAAAAVVGAPFPGPLTA